MIPVVKICGIRTAAACDAAMDGQADMIGMVFCPASPRYISCRDAADLASRIPAGIERVGVLADPDDDFLDSLLGMVPLDILQLHGRETPERVAAIRTLAGRPVIKAVQAGNREDVEAAIPFADIADWLLFDSRPPEGGLPGGNGKRFDWEILAGLSLRRPWILAGGLEADNVQEAIRTSGAMAVDVSSGVESAPGEKDPGLIRAFLSAARGGGHPQA